MGESYFAVRYSPERRPTLRPLEAAHSRVQSATLPLHIAPPPTAMLPDSSSDAAPVLNSQAAIPLFSQHVPVNPSSSSSIHSANSSQDGSTSLSISTIHSHSRPLPIVPCAPADTQDLKYHRTVY
jgi:hypothetical protein